MGQGEKTYEVDEVLKKIKQLIDDVKYGDITLIIQDGKVIQINKTEKIRL